jgi:hypothetical protein
LDYYGTKDEIINFVLNSSEEVNSKVALFIAGMQAQKSLMNCGQKENESLFEKNEEKFDSVNSH